MVVEAAVGGLWASVAWNTLGSIALPEPPGSAIAVADALAKMLFFWLLVALAVLDFEHLWLPDWLTLPGAAVGFIATTVLAPLDEFWWTDRLSPVTAAIDDLLAIVLAAGLVLMIRLIYWLARRKEVLGLGDAKLMAMLAA